MKTYAKGWAARLGKGIRGYTMLRLDAASDAKRALSLSHTRVDGEDEAVGGRVDAGSRWAGMVGDASDDGILQPRSPQDKNTGAGSGRSSFQQVAMDSRREARGSLRWTAFRDDPTTAES